MSNVVATPDATERRSDRTQGSQRTYDVVCEMCL